MANSPPPPSSVLFDSLKAQRDPEWDLGISNIQSIRECSVERIQTVPETTADRNVANCIPAEEVASAEIAGKIIICCGTEQELFCLDTAPDWVSGEGVL